MAFHSTLKRLNAISTRFDFGVLAHIYAHARAQSQYADKVVVNKKTPRMNRQSLLGLVENLISTIKKRMELGETEWGDYYNNTNYTNYTNSSFQHKNEIVTSWVDRILPQSVWDLGTNDGTFSRITPEKISLQFLLLLTRLQSRRIINTLNMEIMN